MFELVEINQKTAMHLLENNYYAYFRNQFIVIANLLFIIIYIIAHTDRDT